MIINLSFDYEPRGYACLDKDGENMTIFLSTVSGIPYHLDSVPFNGIDGIIEEFVIHELIHKFTGVREDKIIDGWHILLCRSLCLEVSKSPEIKDCRCPIDCFWRDQYASSSLWG